MATTTIKDGYNGGSDNQLKVNADGSINVDVSGGGGSPTNVNITEVNGITITGSNLPTTNPSIGVNGSPAPSSSTEVGAVDPSGNLAGLKVDSSGNLFVTLEGVVVSVTATSPLFSSGGITPNITIQQATSLQNGYLSDVDWITFNDKVSIVGAFDSQAPSANGLTINLQDIYAQSASVSFPGMVNNTTQSFSGNKTFTGTVAISPSSITALTIDSTSFIFDSTNQALGIGLQPSTTAFIDAINTSGATKRIVMTGYGTGSFVGTRDRFARGTIGSPSAVQTGDNLGFISGQGYGTSQFPATSTAALNFIAGENFTNASNLTYVQVMTTPTGSVTSAEAMRVASTGVTLGPQSSSTAIHQVNGGVNYTTKTVSSATYTVDSTTTDYIIFTNSTSNTIAVTLPAPTNGRVLYIEDISGTSGTNNITIKQHGSETINGLTQYVLAKNYIGIQLISDGTNWSAIKVSDSGSLFITAGTTYVTPSNITPQTRFKFTLIGGGGGSAGVATANGRGTGGGGAGGGILFTSGLTPSTAYAITIGAAGAAGTSAPTAGGSGGSTTLVIGATTYTASGGGGGPAGASTVGGIPGGATNCTINSEGEWGGWNAAAGANTIGGKGGNSPFGFGNGGPGMGPNTFFGTSITGSGYGSGGGGAADVGAAVAGAVGTQGCILVEWQN